MSLASKLSLTGLPPIPLPKTTRVCTPSSPTATPPLRESSGSLVQPPKRVGSAIAARMVSAKGDRGFMHAQVTQRGGKSGTQKNARASSELHFQTRSLGGFPLPGVRAKEDDCASKTGRRIFLSRQRATQPEPSGGGWSDGGTNKSAVSSPTTMLTSHQSPITPRTSDGPISSPLTRHSLGGTLHFSGCSGKSFAYRASSAGTSFGTM